MSRSFNRSSLVVAAGLVAVACNTAPLVDVSGGVAGEVCNPQTGRPAQKATVTASFTNPRTGKAGTKSATTDDNGFFKLGGLPAETVDLHVVQTDSFQDDIKAVKVSASADAQLTDPACRDAPKDPGHGSISGQVCNKHTGSYVQNAAVTVQLPDGSKLTTNTDDNGNFQLDGVPAGDQIVVVDGSGFRKTFRVTVIENQINPLETDGITCTPYDPLTTGFITGKICGSADAGQTPGPLAGAHVFVVTDLGDGATYEDETLDDGTFTIAGIPTTPAPPPLQVRAEKGGFAFVWDNVIVQSVNAAPNGTDLTASVGCQGLNPDDGRKYLVVQGTYDRIEHVLDRMGLHDEVTLIDGDPVDGSDWTQTAFGNKDLLETYDAVFVNCGVDESPYVLNGLNASIKANLKAYVEGGGSLYVSDWAYDIVESTWPEQINFLGDDTKNSAAEFGAGEQTYAANVLDDGLKEYLGTDSINVEFKFDYFAVVSSVASGVTTFLQANEKYHVNNTEQTLPNSPMTVGFSDGQGRVIFTSFHQEQDASNPCTQTSDCNNGLECVDNACTAQLDGPEDQVLRYIIFSL